MDAKNGESESSEPLSTLESDFAELLLAAVARMIEHQERIAALLADLLELHQQLARRLVDEDEISDEPMVDLAGNPIQTAS